MTTNINDTVFRERLKFYADTPRKKNAYFCWELTSILALKEVLWRFFEKGWKIKAAWYEKINKETGEIVDNSRINLQQELDEFFDHKFHSKHQ